MRPAQYRRRGDALVSAWRIAGMSTSGGSSAPGFIAVLMLPGLSRLTPMPCGAKPRRIAAAMPSSANFDVS